MTTFQQLDALFERNNGILKTSQALQLGMTKPMFYSYARQRGLEQVAHGIYLSPDA